MLFHSSNVAMKCPSLSLHYHTHRYGCKCGLPYLQSKCCCKNDYYSTHSIDHFLLNDRSGAIMDNELVREVWLTSLIENKVVLHVSLSLLPHICTIS